MLHIEMKHLATTRVSPVPLTILTGFLGAGKTTLLNQLLNGDHGLRVAVLVNDFGSVNIDADLVVGVKDDVISLANGCICCTIRDDLVGTVLDIVNRPEAPGYILLEASGVADPAGISLAFLNAALRDRIRLDGVMCVVDAEQVFAVPEMMNLKLRQIAFSDMIILNKVDLVGSEEIGRIRDWLDKHFHRFRLFETSHANVPLEILLSAGSLAPSPHDEHEDIECNDPGCRHGHHLHYRPCNGDHADVFSTWTFETDQPLSLEALRRAATKLPASIYRSKGVIHSCEEPGRRSILQVVGKRADISTESGWNGRPPRTRIVVIGAPGSIIPHQLQAHFDACIAVGQ